MQAASDIFHWCPFIFEPPKSATIPCINIKSFYVKHTKCFNFNINTKRFIEAIYFIFSCCVVLHYFFFAFIKYNCFDQRFFLSHFFSVTIAKQKSLLMLNCNVCSIKTSKYVPTQKKIYSNLKCRQN